MSGSSSSSSAGMRPRSARRWPPRACSRAPFWSRTSPWRASASAPSRRSATRPCPIFPSCWPAVSPSSGAERPAILTLGARSAGLAERLMAALPGAERHAPACAACAAEVRFAKAADHLRELFSAGRPIVGICAAGILIRAVAPLLADKRLGAARDRRGGGRLGGGAAPGRPPRRQRARQDDRRSPGRPAGGHDGRRYPSRRRPRRAAARLAPRRPRDQQELRLGAARGLFCSAHGRSRRCGLARRLGPLDRSDSRARDPRDAPSRRSRALAGSCSIRPCWRSASVPSAAHRPRP